MKYYQDEKILVFYEGDNIAYYIAQMLELLHIKHEIYAKSLAAALKSEYVVRFNEEPQDRVLLMDVKHAAHGLNISSASRVYFVNPVCRPDIEAQAIKRAHRIGQTRKVFVETLVLKGTVEEKMHERAQRMTNVEHHVSHLEDDYGMREIIQSARFMLVEEHEKFDWAQVAPLKVPQQLWARPGWRETLTKSKFISGKKREPDAHAGADIGDGVQPPKKKRKQKAVRLLSPPPQMASPIGYVPALPSNLQDDVQFQSTAPGINSTVENESDEDDEPMADHWRRQSQGTQDTVIAEQYAAQHSPAAAPAETPVGPSANGILAAQHDAVDQRRVSMAGLLN